MKIQGFQKTGLALMAASVMALSTAVVFGQNTTTAPADNSSASTTTATLAVTPAMSQVLQLAQAKISDSTIIAYVQNSGTVFGMNASQIVYLKQQGVSESVINAMLNQRTALAAAPQPQMPPENSAQYTSPDNTQPITTVAQPTTPAPSTTYIIPDTQTYYYNSWAYPNYYPYYYPYYYSWYYPVGFYWGWHGGGYYGGWHGGYGGGWHGGGGYHTGGGGGFHGGGGGGFHH